MSLVLDVPMPPTLTNSAKGRSRHWRVAWLEKTNYWKRLDSMLMAGLIPPPMLQPWSKVRIASVMHLGGAMDDDNAMARHKPLLDWIKTRGYVTDDRKKNIKWDALPEQIVKRNGHYRIVLTLSEITQPESTEEHPHGST